MKLINYLFIVLSALALLACSPDTTPQSKLFEGQRDALDKAKDVENTVQQQTQDMQKNLDKQTQ